MSNESLPLPPEADIRARFAAADELVRAVEGLRTSAHCIAKAGPASTPTLAVAWGKFMGLSAQAAGALHAYRKAVAPAVAQPGGVDWRPRGQFAQALADLRELHAAHPPQKRPTETNSA